jgi:hypothetical protein
MKNKFDFEEYLFERPSLLIAAGVCFAAIIWCMTWGVYLIKMACQ